jgi:hypothetical protein
MADLDPAVEQQLADMSDHDWRALSARVRPPTSTQQLREIAGKVLDGAALDSFVAVADPKKFAAENGDIDEEKVMGHMTAIFAAGQPQQRRDWGQGSPAGGPPKQPGDDARSELRKRFGVGSTDAEPSKQGIRHGADARAELAKRYGGHRK